MKRKKLQGIVPPMVTPLKDSDTLDGEGLEKLLERMVAGGVHGVFLLGSTGEAPSLSYRLRREVIEASCRIIRGRIPVLVGISDTAFDESLALAKVATDAGADAAVVAPPFYFPIQGQELIRYYRKLAKALPLPMILYHMPDLTKVKFDLDVVRFAVDMPEILALKESSGNLDFFWRACHIAQARADFSVFVGPEHLLAPAIRLGGDGGVNGGANLFPELFVQMYHAVLAGDVSRIDVLQTKIDQLGEIYHVARGGMGVCRGIKCALQCLGICGEMPAEPFGVLDEEERREIGRIVERIKNT